MNKDEILDLILKAVALFLFALAIMSLPAVVNALLQTIMLSKATLEALVGDATFGEVLMTTGFMAGVNGVLRFVLYIIVARDLFSGGSWARRILSTGDAVQRNVTATM